MRKFVTGFLCLFLCGQTPAPKIYTPKLTLDQIAIIAKAMDMAAKECGATNEDACRIGLAEAAIIANLQEALKAGK